MATYAAFGGRDSGVPMLLGAAAFAALESDAYHHTLPACPQVVLAGATVNSLELPAAVHAMILRLHRSFPRCPLLFIDDSSCTPLWKPAALETSREVQWIPQALKFSIIIKRAGTQPVKFQGF